MMLPSFPGKLSSPIAQHPVSVSDWPRETKALDNATYTKYHGPRRRRSGGVVSESCVFLVLHPDPPSLRTPVFTTTGRRPHVRGLSLNVEGDSHTRKIGPVLPFFLRGHRSPSCLRNHEQSKERRNERTNRALTPPFLLRFAKSNFAKVDRV